MISIKFAKRCCCEDISHIENYEQAKNDPRKYSWVLHHRLEIGYGYEITEEEMISMGLYYHRPACELIFMPYGEHTSLHNNVKSILGTHKTLFKKGYKPTEETKEKIRNKVKGKPRPKVAGKNNPMYGTISPTRGKTKSEFGEKFKEHFGITMYQDLKLYKREHQWFRTHGQKCRWEVE